jgi:hypothetical protein
MVAAFECPTTFVRGESAGTSSIGKPLATVVASPAFICALHG